MSLDRVFLDYSIDRLRQHSDRIEKRLAGLTDKDLWSREKGANAIGNLVLHLCGNVRQWIVSSVGGAPDTRVRDREFAARGDVAASELRDRLHAAVEEAIAVITAVTPERLLERVQPQNHDVTVMEAIYHVVEHFAWHTGQIAM
ncbi:MAG: DinB family protein [Bryobacteraceae bacterium]